jgi:hypothetical protein
MLGPVKVKFSEPHTRIVILEACPGARRGAKGASAAGQGILLQFETIAQKQNRFPPGAAYGRRSPE